MADYFDTINTANSGLSSRGKPTDYRSHFKKMMIKFAKPLYKNGTIYEDYIRIDEEEFANSFSKDFSYRKLHDFVASVDIEENEYLYKFIVESVMDYNEQYNPFQLLLGLVGHPKSEIEDAFEYIYGIIEKHTEEELPICFVAQGVMSILIYSCATSNKADLELYKQKVAYSVAISYLESKDIVEDSIPNDFDEHFESVEAFFVQRLKDGEFINLENEKIKSRAIMVCGGGILAILLYFIDQWDFIVETLGLNY